MIPARVRAFAGRVLDELERARLAAGAPAPESLVALVVPVGAVVAIRCPFCLQHWRHTLPDFVTYRAHDTEELARVVGNSSEVFKRHWSRCEKRKTAVERGRTWWHMATVAGVTIFALAFVVIGEVTK